MVYLVVGWANGEKSVYGAYSDEEKAVDRKHSLEGHPYENYEIKQVQLDKGCVI